MSRTRSNQARTARRRPPRRRTDSRTALPREISILGCLIEVDDKCVARKIDTRRHRRARLFRVHFAGRPLADPTSPVHYSVASHAMRIAKTRNPVAAETTKERSNQSILTYPAARVRYQPLASANLQNRANLRSRKAFGAVLSTYITRYRCCRRASQR